MNVFYYSDKGSVREHNEDNLYLDGGKILADSPDHAGGAYTDAEEGLKLYAVFDGMGGEASGQEAARIAATGFKRVENELKKGKKLLSVLEDYVEQMAEEIAEILEGSEIGGTTCVAVQFSEGKMIPFWAGDSRIYLLRDTELRLLSRDDTVGWMQVERGMQTLEQAKRSRGWHMLTKYIGDEDTVFSVGEAIPVKEGDRIILCSDGVSDCATQEELEALFGSVQTELERRVAALVERESDDNGTVVVIEI